MRIFAMILPAVISLNWFGLFWSGWLFLLVMATFFIVRALRESYTDKINWGRRWENVYIIDEAAKIDFEVNHAPLVPLCIFVPEGGMVRAMKDATEKLRGAGNKFISPDKDKEYSVQTWEAIKIQVLPIWRQSGEWVNENMAEYVERAAQVIKHDRQIRHQNLKALAPEWYQRWHHKEIL